MRSYIIPVLHFQSKRPVSLTYVYKFPVRSTIRRPIRYITLIKAQVVGYEYMTISTNSIYSHFYWNAECLCRRASARGAHLRNWIVMIGIESFDVPEGGHLAGVRCGRMWDRVQGNRSCYTLCPPRVETSHCFFGSMIETPLLLLLNYLLRLSWRSLSKPGETPV
jgi:hypothetical protein